MMFPSSNDDSLRLPTDDRAFTAIFIGRADEINRFQFYLDQWKIRMSAASSLPASQQVEDAIPRRDNKISGLVALLYGRGGFGKSTLLKHYSEIAMQPGRNLAVSAIIDWQLVSVVVGNRDMFNPPPGQAIDAEAYFMVLSAQLANKLGKNSDKLKEFNKAVAAIQNARKQINGELDNARKDQRYEWLTKAASQEVVALIRGAFPVVNVVPGIETMAGAAEQGLELGAKYGISQVEQLSKRLRDKLRHDTALDFLAPELKLGVGLGKDLAQFAKDLPLLIFIDTYELADEGDQFLRIVMKAAGPRVGWVIAGRDNLWGGKDFYMRSSRNIVAYKEIVDFGFAVDFNSGGVGAFTVADIIEYFTLLYQNVAQLPDTDGLQLPATLSEADAARILDVTEGVPLAVQIAAGIYLESGDLNAVTKEDDGRPKIVDRMVQRYLQHVQDDPADRARLYGLALLRRSDTHQADAIAAALGLSEDQGNKSNYDNELRRLHRRYSFIFSEKAQTLLHKEVRDFLRQSLLERLGDPDIKEINQRLWKAHKLLLESLEEKRQYNDLRERLEETEWVGVYLDLVEQQFWLEPSEGVNYCLPFMLAEAIYGRSASQERPYANPEAIAVGNFFTRELQHPYNSRWEWAASSLVYLRNEYPSPEALRGLEELEKLVSQRCPSFPVLQSDYRSKLKAALWWRLGEAYAGIDDNKALAWYEQALKWLDEEKDLRLAVAGISWNIGFKLINDEKKYAESLPYIDRSLELDPENSYAYNGRGVAYKNLKNYDQALKNYDEAIKRDPNFILVYNNRGNLYYARKDYEQALREYSKALELDPNYADAYNNRGRIYYARKDYEQALREYNKALELDPRNVDAYNNRGLVYYTRKDYEQALREYDKVLELDPGYAAACNNRGLIYYEWEDYERALQEYNRALELNPHYALAYNNRGRIYYIRKDYERALREYSKALELDPDFVYAYNNRGNLYYDRKDYERALQEYNNALELDPSYADAYNNRGLIYFNRKDYERALQEYNRVLELDPRNVDACNNRGRVYAMRKDYERALQEYNRALELDPGYVYAYSNRGNLYFDRKDYERALQEYNKALEFDPGYADGYSNRGLVYAARGDYDAALQEYNRALEQDPDYAIAYNNRGNLYYDRKDYERALQEYSKALELDPDYVDVYNNRGNLYTALKRYDMALWEYQKALELDHGNLYAYNNLAFVYLLLKDVEHSREYFRHSWESDSSDVNIGWMAEWVGMGKQRPGLELAERLEKIAEFDPEHYAALTCKGLALGLRRNLNAELEKLEQAISLNGGEWDAYFWKGMTCAYLGRYAAASEAIDKALALNLPPLLLTPLYWLEHDRPDFFREYARPLLEKYGV